MTIDLYKDTDVVKFVVANTFNNEYVIVNAPQFILEYGVLNGCVCSDNAFSNCDLIPQEKGLYEVECRFYWDYGRCAFSEGTEPGLEFRIINVSPIYIL